MFLSKHFTRVVNSFLPSATPSKLSANGRFVMLYPPMLQEAIERPQLVINSSLNSDGFIGVSIELHNNIDQVLIYIVSFNGGAQCKITIIIIMHLLSATIIKNSSAALYKSYKYIQF